MNNAWNLALEQSSDLAVTHGSVHSVADAVRRGADLRLFLIAKGYEETLCFQQTYGQQSAAPCSGLSKMPDGV